MTATTAENALAAEVAAFNRINEAIERFITARAEYDMRMAAWRASPEGIAWRERMRRQDAAVDAYWREIDKGTPARPIGSGGSISAGANSAGRGA